MIAEELTNQRIMYLPKQDEKEEAVKKQAPPPEQTDEQAMKELMKIMKLKVLLTFIHPSIHPPIHSFTRSHLNNRTLRIYIFSSSLVDMKYTYRIHRIGNKWR